MFNILIVNNLKKIDRKEINLSNEFIRVKLGNI
jgi:hypothetical protein